MALEKISFYPHGMSKGKTWLILVAWGIMTAISCCLLYNYSTVIVL
jgi:hypothetical protein